MNQETDIIAIKKISEGDTEAFREIVNTYKDKAYSLTYRILKNKDDTNDSLQDAFFKIYSLIKEKKFEYKSKFSTYIYTVVYNTAIDNYRRLYSRKLNIVSININEYNYRDGDELTKNFKYESKAGITETTYAADDKLSTEEKHREQEINSIVSEYLNSIPINYSLILNLFYINEMSIKEISELLKIPEGTIKNRIFRAKEKLKEILLKRFKEEELMEYV